MKNLTPPNTAINYGFLQAGWSILFDGKRCKIVRVTDCSAVVAVAVAPVAFTRLSGQTVNIKAPATNLVRISLRSEVPVFLSSPI